MGSDVREPLDLECSAVCLPGVRIHTRDLHLRQELGADADHLIAVEGPVLYCFAAAGSADG